MKNKEYFFKIIINYLNKNKKIRVNRFIQSLYDQYGYGYDEISDANLLMSLQGYNMNLEIPLLATGQNGYFNDQIEKNGLTSQTLDEQDLEDAKFIAESFGKNTNYGNNNVPINYITMLGSTEFNYASQSFPAGILEDVFQCSPNRDFPIQLILGEREQDFYLRLLHFQMKNIETFDTNKEIEVINRARRLLENFCKNKNRVYIIGLDDVLNCKAAAGDVLGLRDGSLSNEEAINKIESLDTFEQLLNSFNIDSTNMFHDQNLNGEYGISVYSPIPRNKLSYIEVERSYILLQKRAFDLGYKIGDEILIHEKSQEQHIK